MSQFSKTDQKRITFLSLLSSASQLEPGAPGDVPYNQAQAWLDQMEEDGFFTEERAPARPTQQRSGRSARPASRGQSSRSGNGGSRGGFSGNYRDPDGPPTDKQVAAVLALTDDYSEDELFDMTKQEVGNLISDLKG